MEFKFGTDPELFVKDTRTNRFISAHGMVRGTKDEPEPVEDGAVQVDGTALEFNIHASEDETTFSKRIGRVLEQLKERVFEIDKNYALVITPFAEFDKNYFDNEIPLSAKILGCDPDFNNMGVVNPNPGDKIFDKPFRTAAGHFHIGWRPGGAVDDPWHFEDCRFVAGGLFNQLLYNYRTTNEEQRRLQYYGMNGSFRSKPYGVEFRYPSNLWILTDESRRKMYKTVSEYMGSLAKARGL